MSHPPDPETFYLWLDFETTGLDVDGADIPLEVGWILTDTSLDHQLSTGRCLLSGWTADMVLSSFVRDMHKASGLLKELSETARHKSSLLDAEAEIVWHIAKHTRSGDVIKLAGSGVDFDRRVIRRWMPGLDRTLHYQLMDTSQIRRFLGEIVGFSMEHIRGEPEGLVPHRALDDAKGALRELRRYRALVRRAIGAPIGSEIGQ